MIYWFLFKLKSESNLGRGRAAYTLYIRHPVSPRKLLLPVGTVGDLNPI